MTRSADTAAQSCVLRLRAGWSVHRDAPTCPVTPRSHGVFPPTHTEGAPSHNIPHRVRSSPRGLAPRSIESWHLTHLRPAFRSNHPLPPTSPSSQAPAAAPTTSSKAPAQAPPGAPQAIGIGGTHRYREGRTIGTEPSVCAPVGTAPPARPAGHRTHTSWSCAIESWHITHLPSVVVYLSPTAASDCLISTVALSLNGLLTNLLALSVIRRACLLIRQDLLSELVLHGRLPDVSRTVAVEAVRLAH
jgi:hypothetical protein